MQSEAMDNLLADPGALHGATLLGRYRIERPIGQGGMAHVYAGKHLALEREVAIKVLRQRYARRQSVVDRFLLEARAASRVRHPHIVEVTDFGTTDDGLVFMVMERLEGETLAELVDRDGALPWARVRDIALQLCDALQTAHDAGIVHRDVSLKNCFVICRAHNPDYVKVLDFGIARVQGLPDAPKGRLRRLTSETQIVGTPEFMSPEQASRSGEVDARSDVYAMGILLYALLTGTLPFEAESTVDLVARHLYDPVPPMTDHEPSVPPAVEAVVLKALAKQPEQRFQSMRAFAAALESIDLRGVREIAEAPAEIEPPVSIAATPPRRTRRLEHAALLGVVVGLAWWGWRDRGGLELAMLPASAAALDRWVAPTPTTDIHVAATPVEPEPIEAEPVEPVAVAPVAVTAELPPVPGPIPRRVENGEDPDEAPDDRATPLRVSVPPPPADLPKPRVRKVPAKPAARSKPAPIAAEPNAEVDTPAQEPTAGAPMEPPPAEPPPVEAPASEGTDLALPEP